MNKFISIADFYKKGGWLMDSQFIQTMGMPYLLAHGLGSPVADAKATVAIESKGKYHIYAYTYNWNAPWKPEYAPGIFEISIGDYKKVFGDTGDDWNWQDGGEVELTEGDYDITLRDLTGYEGRLAAILITDESPKKPQEYIETPTDVTTEYDYIVVGGGITGITAAISAARNGLKTALVQDRPVLGGNNSSEVRVWLSGKTCFEKFPKLGNITNELEQEVAHISGIGNKSSNYEDDKKYQLVEKEKNIDIYLCHSVIGADTDNGHIKDIVCMDLNKCISIRLSSPLYADCSGDGVLAMLAGADYEVTMSGHMEQSNFWCIADTGEEQKFERCPWAIDLTTPDFPGRLRANGTDPEGEKKVAETLGNWRWGAGFEHDPIGKAEYARDTNFRAMYGAWDALKNVDGDFKTYKIVESCHISGKRESRRFFGPVILTTDDMIDKNYYNDAIVGIDWALDVHTPHRGYYGAYVEGDAFICTDCTTQWNPPYYLPYRCLYSRNIDNLFIAGRCISTTHDALGPVRVMRTCGMMGEVIGKAAALCKEHAIKPDGVYREKIEELKSYFK